MTAKLMIILMSKLIKRKRTASIKRRSFLQLTRAASGIPPDSNRLLRHRRTNPNFILASSAAVVHPTVLASWDQR